MHSVSAEGFLAVSPETEFYCLTDEKLQDGCFCQEERKGKKMRELGGSKKKSPRKMGFLDLMQQGI